MAASTSLPQFLHRLELYQKALVSVPKVQAQTLKRDGRIIVLKHAALATGGDWIMSRAGSSGATLGVRVTEQLTESSDAVVFQATPGGPWSWLERGTKAHTIASKKFRGSRAGRGERVAFSGLRRLRKNAVGRPVIVIPGIGIRAYAHHPGAKRTSKPWTKAATELKAVAPKIVADAAIAAMNRVAAS